MNCSRTEQTKRSIAYVNESREKYLVIFPKVLRHMTLKYETTAGNSCIHSADLIITTEQTNTRYQSTCMQYRLYSLVSRQ